MVQRPVLGNRLCRSSALVQRDRYTRQDLEPGHWIHVLTPWLGPTLLATLRYEIWLSILGTIATGVWA
jgi:hypothetical protein